MLWKKFVKLIRELGSEKKYWDFRVKCLVNGYFPNSFPQYFNFERVIFPQNFGKDILRKSSYLQK